MRKYPFFSYIHKDKTYILHDYDVVLSKHTIDSDTTAFIKMTIYAQTGNMPSDDLILDMKRHSRQLDAW